MDRRTLDHLGMPRTGLRYAMQALASARRRWQQARPGHEPKTPPGDPPVSHYSGPEEEAILGGEPESPAEAASKGSKKNSGTLPRPER